MSNTTTIVPIISALKKMLEHGSAIADFLSINSLQEQFLIKYFEAGKKDLISFSDKELESIASNDSEKINSFLKERGFDVDISPFEDPTDFGVASVLKVLTEWFEKGEKVKIRAANGQVYPGINLERSVYKLTRTKQHPNPIAEISCKNGDKVYITIADREYNTWNLLDRVLLITKDREYQYGYDGFYFPMVDLDQKVDIGFFKGMYFEGQKFPYKIKTAKQQTKFKMNEIGAKVESAVYFEAACAASAMEPNPPLVIDRPFFVWIIKEGNNLPYFAGYITEEDWKDTRFTTGEFDNVAIVSRSGRKSNHNRSDYSVELNSIGNNKVQVLKTIRSIFNCSLGEAVSYINNLPCIIAYDLSLRDASYAENELKKAGAIVKLL